VSFQCLGFCGYGSGKTMGQSLGTGIIWAACKSKGAEWEGLSGLGICVCD